MVFDGDAAEGPLRLSRSCPRLKGNNAGSLVAGERFQNSLAIVFRSRQQPVQHEPGRYIFGAERWLSRYHPLGNLEQRKHVVAEVSVPGFGWGSPSQGSVFRQCCRVLGGEFDVHRSRGCADCKHLGSAEVETKPNRQSRGLSAIPGTLESLGTQTIRSLHNVTPGQSMPARDPTAPWPGGV